MKDDDRCRFVLDYEGAVCCVPRSAHNEVKGHPFREKTKIVKSNLQALEDDLYAMNFFSIYREEYLSFNTNGIRFEIYPVRGHWVVIALGGKEPNTRILELDTPAGERPSASVIKKWIMERIEEERDGRTV